MSNDVVVTGFGCCTPFATEPKDLLDQMEQGGERPEEVLRQVPIPADLGGGHEMMAVVPGPDAMSIAGVRRPFPDRATLMSFIAVEKAIASASLNTNGAFGNSVGVVVNTCFGPSETVERYLRTLLSKGPAQVSAIAFSRAVSNSIVGEVARRYNLRGPSTVVLGSSALGYATDLLNIGAARSIICIGVDEVRDLHLWAYRRVGLLTDGLWLGEGAAALVLELREHAEARGATILSVLVGYATNFCGASVHRITDVTDEAIEACVRAALRNSRCGRIRRELHYKPCERSFRTGRGRGTRGRTNL